MLKGIKKVLSQALPFLVFGLAVVIPAIVSWASIPDTVPQKPAAVSWAAQSVEPAVDHPSPSQQPLDAGGDSPQIPSPAVSPAVKNINVLGMTAKAVFSDEIGADGSQRVLFAQKPNEVMPIASLTKLMTTLVVLENYQLDEPVTITPDVMAVEGAQGDLQEGQTLTVENLLYTLLLESSNRAAKALSDIMGTDQFVAMMNQKAGELGLAHTHYADPAGLSNNSTSTARDVAALASYLFSHYPLFATISGTQEYSVVTADGQPHHQAKNINELLGFSNIIAGKTGYTNDAAQCLMEIQKGKNSGYAVSVVLHSDDRFGDMKKLINWDSGKVNL